MNTFAEKLRLVPRAAWITGICLGVVVVTALALGPLRFDPQLRSWHWALKAAMLAAPTCMVVSYPLLVGFIYADARRRGMRHVMWAWLAVVPYFVGVVMYFIMRSPLPTPCPKCRTEVAQAFAYCPRCGASVHPLCAGCGKALDADWASCPYCGIRIAAQAGTAPVRS